MEVKEGIIAVPRQREGGEDKQSRGDNDAHCRLCLFRNLGPFKERGYGGYDGNASENAYRYKEYVVGIILLSAGTPEENFGISWGGLMFAILGINFLIAPTWVLEEMKKKEGKGKKKGTSKKNSSSIRTIGKDHDEFYHENYDDMAE